MHGERCFHRAPAFTVMGVIHGGWWCAYIAAAPSHTGVALMRRHRREGGVQCRVGSTQEPATGLSVAAGWESRSPSEVESDDQAINPARGGEVPLKK